MGLEPREEGLEGEFWALRDLSFKINEGEIVGIIGKNGAGKSTLLKILSRITPPSRGEIRIKGRVASLLEVGTGFHPDLTGRENVLMNGVVMGMSRSEVLRKFDEIVSFAELEKFIDTPVKWYSSGMYVRLAFAVAAHLDPEVLIVDEVLSVGDINFQKKSMGKMETLQGGGRTVLFVSHSLATISRLCSRCILLDKGQLLLDGPTEKVVSAYLGRTSQKQPKTFEQAYDMNKDVHLRKVAVNEHVPGDSTDFSYEMPIRIAVEFQLNREISNVTCWLNIETVDQTVVFSTADYDMSIDRLGVRKPGIYHYEVEIPGKWLNHGRYRIVAGLVRNHPVEVYERTETVEFTIVEIGTPGAILESGTRRGVLQPYLPWKEIHAPL